MVSDNERAARIVRFWRSVEMFSTQDVPRPSLQVSSEKGGVLDLAADEVAPWEQGHPLTREPPRKGMTWQFTVYGGLYDIGRARAELVRVFGQDSKPDDGRKAGNTALFALTLDAEGQLLTDSAVLSSCAWAISRLRSPGPSQPRWLNGFDQDQRGFAAALNKLVAPKLGGVDGEPTSSGFADRVRSAGRDALAAGVQEVGTVAGGAAASAVGSVFGPLVGVIASKAVAAFVTRVLSPTNAGSTSTASGAEPVVPRIDITAPALHAFAADLAAALDVGKALRPAGVRVKCTLVPIQQDAEAEPGFLNSFIAEDLARIETELGNGNYGPALRGYLADATDLPVRDRVNVRTDCEAVISGVAPTRAPHGRWPTTVTKPLVTSQQFAVNELMDQLGTGAGVFAVNGPPGTGKTTMLRDVLAAIVVERAGRLAKLTQPADAFTKALEQVKVTDRYKPSVYALRPEVTGFEIVLATAGNLAAKNVTAEIPALAAVGGAEEPALAADYFTDLASHVLGAKSWGLVAAVLGNMGYRDTFGTRFWFGNVQSRENPQRREGDEVLGMLNILLKVRDDPAAAPDWGDAVQAFRKADTLVRRLAAERQEIADAIIELARQQAAVPGHEATIRHAAGECEVIKEKIAATYESLKRERLLYRHIDDDYRTHTDHKPGFWVSLATFFRAGRQWYAEDQRLSQLRTDANARVTALEELYAEQKAALTAKQLARRRAENALRDAQHAIAATRGRIKAAIQQWPGKVPSDDLNDEALQLCAPWADENLTAARNAVFLAALHLHKAFVLNTEKHIRGNLAVAVAAIRGKLTSTPGRQTLLAAWQSLFLVVPMVSTTFASLPKLFDGLGKESLGWLFIDEAGQATPQQAVGGIWRTRRAVIVGDPRQLEPIVTLPSSAQEAMLAYHQVAEEWTPDNTSVQRVADRLARYGTELTEPDGETTVWVGAPLRVHRRCDRPIFDISNTIAYGGDLMVYGTATRDRYPGQNLWLDVHATQSEGNWIPAEGQTLLGLLDELVAQQVPLSEIRVISPSETSSGAARTSWGPPLAEPLPAATSGPCTPFKDKNPTSSSWSSAAHPATPRHATGPPTSPTCSTSQPHGPNAGSTSSATTSDGHTCRTSQRSQQLFPADQLGSSSPFLDRSPPGRPMPKAESPIFGAWLRRTGNRMVVTPPPLHL